MRNPNTEPTRHKAVHSSDWLDDLEAALCKINEAEGYFLIGKIASGKNMLGDGKARLEKIIEKYPRQSSNSVYTPTDSYNEQPDPSKKH